MSAQGPDISCSFNMLQSFSRTFVLQGRIQVEEPHILISSFDIERQSKAALLALARILLILIKCLHCLFDERRSL